MLVAPLIVVMSWLLLASVLEYESDFCRFKLATVLVAKSFDLLELWFVAKSLEDVLERDFESLTAADCCSPKVLLFDLDAVRVSEAAALAATFADCDAFAAKLEFEL